MAKQKRDPTDETIPVGFRLVPPGRASYYHMPLGDRDYTLDEIANQIGAIAKAFCDDCQDRIIAGKRIPPVILLELYIVARNPKQTQADDGENIQELDFRAAGRQGIPEEVSDALRLPNTPLGRPGDDTATGEAHNAR